MVFPRYGRHWVSQLNRESLDNTVGDVERKRELSRSLAAAFAASPALGQVSVDQKLQILQQEIDDLKAQARRAVPSTQQPAAPYSQDYSSPLGRSLALASGGADITGSGGGGCSKFWPDGDATGRP